MAGGRPSKLTPEIHARIVKIIQAGNYVETAAAYAGVAKDSLYEWLKRGAKERERLAKDKKARLRKKEAAYIAFSDAIEKALAEAEIRDVTTIAAAAKDQWQAAAWRLERKCYKRWGRKDTMALTDPEGGAVKIKVTVTGDANTLLGGDANAANTRSGT